MSLWSLKTNGSLFTGLAPRLLSDVSFLPEAIRWYCRFRDVKLSPMISVFGQLLDLLHNKTCAAFFDCHAVFLPKTARLFLVTCNVLQSFLQSYTYVSCGRVTHEFSDFFAPNIVLVWYLPIIVLLILSVSVIRGPTSTGIGSFVLDSQRQGPIVTDLSLSQAIASRSNFENFSIFHHFLFFFRELVCHPLVLSSLSHGSWLLPCWATCNWVTSTFP